MPVIKLGDLTTFTGDPSGSYLVVNDSTNTATYKIQRESLLGSQFDGTASYASTASFVNLAQTASYVATASWAFNALTASSADDLTVRGDITSSNALFTGVVSAADANFTGNISVQGTASFNYVEQITGSAVMIGQEFIVLNTQTPAARYAGMQVYDSGSFQTASIVWDSQTNNFVYQNVSSSTYSGGGFLAGPRNTGSLSDVTYPTLNRVVRGQGGDHLYDSNITDDNTKVSIGINTEVLGSLNVTSGVTGSLFGTSSWAQNILSTAVVGNLSQIATGSVTASVNTNSASFQVVSGSSTLLFVSNSGNVFISNGGLYFDGSRTISPSTPSSTGAGSSITITGGNANTLGAGGAVNIYGGLGAGAQAKGAINIGLSGYDTVNLGGMVYVINSGPNTGNAFQILAGGQNALNVYWDNLTPYMQYGLVSGRQSRFTNSTSYTFDNKFLIGTNTDAGYKLLVTGSGASGSMNIDGTLYVSGSNVGIGTTGSAAYKLEVSGGLKITGASIISSSLTMVTPGYTSGYMRPGSDGIELGNANSGVHIRIRNSNRTALDQSVAMGSPGFGWTTSEKLTINTLDTTVGSSAIWVGNGTNNNIFKVYGDGTVSIGPIISSGYALQVSSTASGSLNVNNVLLVSGSSVQVTGSLIVTGSQSITGSLNVTSGITGSLFGTSSWSSNATTAQSVTIPLSSGYFGYLEFGGTDFRLRHSNSGTHINMNASNTTTFYQICSFTNGLRVSPGGNSTTLAFNANVGVYPATTIATFTSGSVTLLTVSGSGVIINESLNINDSLIISGSSRITGSVMATGSIFLIGSLLVSGSQTITGSLTVTQNITGSRLYLSSSNGTSSGSTLIVYGSGSSQPVFIVQGSQGELFSVNDSLSGSLFSVNDVSGLPVMEAFSDNRVLMGSYQAPALYTTVKVISVAGNNVIYQSLPTASYDGMFVNYTARSGSNGRVGKLSGMWSASAVVFSEFATSSFGDTTGLAFTMFVTGGNMAVTASTTTANWSIKTVINGI